MTIFSTPREVFVWALITIFNFCINLENQGWFDHGSNGETRVPSDLLIECIHVYLPLSSIFHRTLSTMQGEAVFSFLFFITDNSICSQFLSPFILPNSSVLKRILAHKLRG